MTPEQRVIGWANGMLRQPFEWGRTDCAMLTLEALEQFTGRPLADPYRNAWRSEAEALAHFQVEHPSQVLQDLGATEQPVAFAVIGDVLTAPADPWPESLHFVLGRFSLSAGPETGVGLVLTSGLLSRPGARLWRVA